MPQICCCGCAHCCVSCPICIRSILLLKHLGSIHRDIVLRCERRRRAVSGHVKGLCQVHVDQFSPQRRRPKPPAVLSSIVAFYSLRSALPWRPNSQRGHRAPAVCQIAFGDGLEDDRAGLDRNAQVYPRLECSLTLPPSFRACPKGGRKKKFSSFSDRF